MSSPVVPDRPERFTPNLNLRVLADNENADIVTILGDMLDEVDEVVPEQVALAAEHALAAQLAAVVAMTTAQRDALPAEQRPVGRIIYNTTDARFEGVINGGAWSPVAIPTKVEVFTTSGVYTKPAFATKVEVIVIGGGGGGGGTASGTAGGGGARNTGTISAAALSATTAVTVGAAGTGAAAAGSFGNTQGSPSAFGAFVGAGGAQQGGIRGSAFGNVDDPTTNGGPGGVNSVGQGAMFGGGGGGGAGQSGGPSGLLPGGGPNAAGGSRSGSGLAGSGGGGNQTPASTGGVGGIPGGGGGVGMAIGGVGGRGEVIVFTHF